MSSDDAALVRPISVPGHPVVVGGLVGLSGATAFVLVNAPGLPDVWALLARVAWALALVVAVWQMLLRRRRLTPAPPPTRTGGLVYVASVLGMVAAIVLGARLLVGIARPELVPALVVTAVGAHFIPFARAFSAPVFGIIGWAMTALGLVGLLVGWQVAGGLVASATATTAGLVMLVAMARWTHRDDPTVTA